MCSRACTHCIKRGLTHCKHHVQGLGYGDLMPLPMINRGWWSLKNTLHLYIGKHNKVLSTGQSIDVLIIAGRKGVFCPVLQKWHVFVCWLIGGVCLGVSPTNGRQAAQRAGNGNHFSHATTHWTRYLCDTNLSDFQPSYIQLDLSSILQELQTLGWTEDHDEKIWSFWLNHQGFVPLISSWILRWLISRKKRMFGKKCTKRVLESTLALERNNGDRASLKGNYM